MRFLFTMLDNPPGFFEKKSTAKLVYSRTMAGAAIAPSGGARRDRTDDLMLAKHALSQLSYGPGKCKAFAQKRVRPFAKQMAESAANKRSIRVDGALTMIEHITQQEWWAWEDLNLRPHAYQARALTN